jgi:hypothetical protein
MFLGIVFGLTVGILVLMSGWFRLGLLFLTKGFIGDNIPWLYLILGVYIGKGISDGFSTIEYWITFISSMLCALVVNQVSAKYEMKSDGNYGTVSTSGSMILVGGLIGMIYHLIFS